MTETTEPQQPTYTATTEHTGPGRLTFADLKAFVGDCDAMNGTPKIEIEIETEYDRELREMVHVSWTLTATTSSTGA